MGEENNMINSREHLPLKIRERDRNQEKENLRKLCVHKQEVV